MTFWQISNDRATNKKVDYTSLVTPESNEECMASFMLMSGYLTSSSLTSPQFYNLENFSHSKLDQLLSTLCSLKGLDLDYADFYLDYDSDYIKFKNLIEEFIAINFKATKIRIFPFRLQYFKQWQIAANSIPNAVKVILLMNNLDHVFIPSEDKNFIEFMNFLEGREDDAIGGIMHWQEFITAIGVRKFKDSNILNPVFYNETYYTHGTTLIKTNFFKSWWEQDFTNGQRIVRPDNPFGPWVNFNWSRRYIPSREFFRHLDGYGHVGISAPHANILRPCCQFINGEILHSDWSSGFEGSQFAELPYGKPPTFNLHEKSSISYFQTKDYLINSNSYHFSFFRTMQLIEPKKLKDYCALILILISFLKYAYMREAFKRNFFSYKHYKYRFYYQLVTRYNKFQIRNPTHRKKINGFKFLKFFKK